MKVNLIKYLFICFAAYGILSCTSKNSVKAPSYIDKALQEHIITKVRYLIANNETEIEDNDVSIIGSYSLSFTPEKLIRFLQEEQISDFFLPFNPVVSKIKIGDKIIKCNAQYFFEEDNTLGGILFELNESYTVKNYLYAVLGKPSYRIIGSKVNECYKFLWIKNNIIYDLFSDDNGKLYLAVCGVGSKKMVSLQSFDIIESQLCAFDIKKDAVRVQCGMWNLSYNGVDFVMNRGANTNSYNNEESAREGLKELYLPTGIVRYDDFIEEVIVKLYYRYPSSSSVDNNSSDAELLRSIQREKIMRDAGFEKEANQERNNRWNSQ